MPSRQEMEAAIRAACQKGDVPIVFDCREEGCTHFNHTAYIKRDVGLADVLAALGKVSEKTGELFRVATDGFFESWTKEDAARGSHYCQLGFQWHLPSTLSNQPLETVSEIYQLIKGNNAN